MGTGHMLDDKRYVLSKGTKCFLCLGGHIDCDVDFALYPFGTRETSVIPRVKAAGSQRRLLTSILHRD